MDESSCAGAKMQPFWKGGIFVPAAFLYYFGNCGACDINDIQDDLNKGVETLATRLGAKRMRLLSAASTTLSALVLLFGSGILSDLPSSSSLSLKMIIRRYPSVLGCILSTVLFMIGVSFWTQRNPKDFDMLNAIPLIAMLLSRFVLD